MKKIFIFFAFYLLLFAFVSFAPHPYHVGSVEINYNPKSQTYEITCRFFMDDLENALNRKYNRSVRFLDSKFKKEINRELEQYAIEYFKLKSDNQYIKVDYTGYEEDHESVNFYLESSDTNPPKKVEAAVSFLYNLYDDQLNIIHIIVNGERKSGKLSYPDRYLYQQF